MTGENAVLGRKRCPNFNHDRDTIYDLFERYEQEKKRRFLFDVIDFVAHIHRRLLKLGYTGTPIEAVTRDEVQDFTCAELVLDMFCCQDANSMFYTGDTCQTITRGVGFRFTDLQCLFKHHQQVYHQDSVGMPEVHQLLVNYRTHSGILDMANCVVDLLQEFFPMHIDKLRREQSFFSGPKPILLHSCNDSDLSILLSSESKNSAVEFGAHQAIIVRDRDSIAKLPSILRESNAIILTVAQAKGLEFDDVFLIDFFKNSKATKEWRALNQCSLTEQKQENHPEIDNHLARIDMQQDKQHAGALRPLVFDERQHSLLRYCSLFIDTHVTCAQTHVHMPMHL